MEDILEIEAKLVIGETVYYHGGIPCGSLNWYDRDTSQKIDLNGRINKVIDTGYSFDWECATSISKIREDIDEMEKRGITHINIELSQYYLDCYSISMKAEIHRLETDEEYEERTICEAYKLKTNEARELAEYERLKKKFGI